MECPLPQNSKIRHRFPGINYNIFIGNEDRSSKTKIFTFAEIIKKRNPGKCDVFLIIVPVLTETIFNSGLYTTATLGYLVTRANRTWAASDKHILDNLKAQGINNLQGIINNVEVDDMEEIVGEIPKKRSKFRVVLKQYFFKRFIA